jgi:cytochrome c553
MRHKLNSIIIAFVFFFLLFGIKCKQSDTVADVGYGKEYFKKNCYACHARTYGYKNAPTIFLLNKYDSLNLFNKLNDIMKDSIHSQRLELKKYSRKEIYSIQKYIKTYFDPVY